MARAASAASRAKATGQHPKRREEEPEPVPVRVPPAPDDEPAPAPPVVQGYILPAPVRDGMLEHIAEMRSYFTQQAAQMDVLYSMLASLQPRQIAEL
jgi:hypothetical protein